MLIFAMFLSQILEKVAVRKYAQSKQSFEVQNNKICEDKIEKNSKGKNSFNNALSGSENEYLGFPIFLDFRGIVLFHYQNTLHIGMCC